MKKYLVALTLIFCFSVNAQTSLEVGDQSPEFEATTSDGKLVSIESMDSKIIILDFWASWCGPCIKTLKTTLKPVYEYFDRSEVGIIGISNDLKEEKWRNALAKYEMNWPNIWDEDKSLVRLYEVKGIPTYIIVDSNGLVLASNIYSRNLKSEIKKALKKIDEN
jgi:peroxiredoxin